MSENFLPAESENWQQQAFQFLLKQEYQQAICLYEQAIENEPQQRSYYWDLGLLYLLQGKEAEAHTTWLCGMVEGSFEEIECWTGELAAVLDREAKRLTALGDEEVAWLLRSHLREVAPAEIDNLLYLVQLAIKNETLAAEDLTNWGLISLLEGTAAVFDKNLLLQTLRQLLDFAPLHPLTVEFAAACVPFLKEDVTFVAILIITAVKINYSMNRPDVSVSLAELCLQVDENYGEFWGHLSTFYLGCRNYFKAIEAAKRCYVLSESLTDKIHGNHQILRALMGAGGYCQEAYSALQEQEFLLRLLLENPPDKADKVTASRLLAGCFFFPYIFDEPTRYRPLQNEVARLCQFYFEQSASESSNQYEMTSRKGKFLKPAGKLLRIGYISHCLNSHSVGWLARWLFQYHDRQRFEIYGYFISYRMTGDPLQEWYASQVSVARKIGETSSVEIAQQIVEDEIDILIDLDSLTLDTTCEVMGLKPAPVQVSWLGWDASGLPAIDYYIVDPYVVPDYAEEYYAEKLWRLPHTYLAVDGFEVGVPTLRREDLDIPASAVVYFSGQTGYKRHQDTARLQMKIIKGVPNSYFLIKGQAEEESIRNFFTQLAKEEGVSEERLRFLPLVSSEQIHRANLSLADVVLDTFPYNGATTTMETLWMGISMVTKVGQQFAARNSYTMMINAGVTEGIAWTDEEYVEWGIRLGKDKELRKKISWNLWESRKTSPLWNAKAFTREMEKAYEEMWCRYCDG